MKILAAVFVFIVARAAAASLKNPRSVFGPKDCVKVSRSSAGSCVLSTDCKGSDLSKTEFAFNCIGNEGIVKHSYGFGGFDEQEEFDSGTKCDRCASPSSRRPEPTHAAKAPEQAAAVKAAPKGTAAKVSHKSTPGAIKMAAKSHQRRHKHTSMRKHQKGQDDPVEAAAATASEAHGAAAATASGAHGAAAEAASETHEAADEAASKAHGETHEAAAEAASKAHGAAAATASEPHGAAVATASKADEAAAETASEAHGAASATASEAHETASATTSGIHSSIHNAISKIWPFSGKKSAPETVNYGPSGCVSTYKNQEGHCMMTTNCKGVDISEYEFGVVCVDKHGSPVKHLFGKDSFDEEERFDTLIKCEQCLGLEEIPDEVRLTGEVAIMSKDISSLKDVIKNVSINVQMLNDEVFKAAPAPAPALAKAASPAPASAAGSAAAVLAHHTVRHRRHQDHTSIVHASAKRNLRHSRKGDQPGYRGAAKEDDDRRESLRELARTINGAIPGEIDSEERELKTPEVQNLVPAAGKEAADDSDDDDDGDSDEGYDAD